MAESKAKGILGVGVFGLITYGLFKAGVIQISGVNAFETGVTLQPFLNLGNQIGDWFSSVTGISTTIIAIVIIAYVGHKVISK